MKLALTATGEGLESDLSPVFGRCPYFVVVELADGDVTSTQTVQNQAINQGGGAGISAAQTIGNQGVDAIITGNVGPRAFGVLNQLGIAVYAGRQSSLSENIEAFEQDKLDKIESPGPMGRGRGGSGPGRAGRGQGRSSGRR